MICRLNNHCARPQVEPSSIRAIPDLGSKVPEARLVKGAKFECWYAQEEKWYPATIASLTERGTVMVM